MGFPRIASTGAFTPEKVIKNEFFNQLYNKDIDSFLREKRNIFERRWMSAEQTTSDLIVPAVEQALKRANILPTDVNLLIVATDTPDYLSPSTSAVVQHRMGFKNAGTFDVNSACAGFVTALDIAFKYMTADESYQNVVVVGAYGMSKFLNMDDFKIATLFADGAGAVVLKNDGKTKSLLGSQLFTDGQYHDYMGLYAGGTYMPMTHSVIENKQHLLNFAKKIPLETNSENWPRLARSLLDRAHKTMSDVGHFFLTQINFEVINLTMDLLEQPRNKSYNIMDKYGYTGSACIPMALNDAWEKGALKNGQNIMILTSGGGVSMAAMFVEWNDDQASRGLA